MKKLKFYKETSGRWYIDLPEWQGPKADLEMVEGADTMLNVLSEGNDHVWLILSEEEFDGSDKIEFIRMATEVNNGAYYSLKNYMGIEMNMQMWLCDVTKFVFGGFPEIIYMAKESL